MYAHGAWRRGLAAYPYQNPVIWTLIPYQNPVNPYQNPVSVSTACGYPYQNPVRIGAQVWRWKPADQPKILFEFLGRR